MRQAWVAEYSKGVVFQGDLTPMGKRKITADGTKKQRG